MAPGFMGGGEDKARDEAAEIMRRNRYRGQFVALQGAVRAKDNAAAERSLKALATEYPDSVAAATSYASWLTDRARQPEAFAVVDAFQKRHPDDAVALYQVGRIAAVTGQQLDRGEEALRKYLSLAPTGANGIPTPSNAHFRLGNILEKRGNRDAARTEYETAVRLDGRNDLARKALTALK
jgi:Flp pilus assembly protein TadD